MSERKCRLSDNEIKRLILENARLNKTVQVLMDRMEQKMDQQQDSFTIFQTAIKLEETVNQRTNELSDLNQRLITELQAREKIEEKLKIAKKQAEEANKSKTKFLAAASHDLRQPLNAARLFTGSLSTANIGTENARYVERIGNSLDDLDDLLSVLLNISQLDSGGIIPEFCHFNLQVRSLLAKGSVFAITLSRGDKNKIICDMSDPANLTLPGNLAGRVIAVIDNDKDVLDGMTALLGKWSCNIIAGTSADICLEQLIEQDKTPELVIADYHLAGDTIGLDSPKAPSTSGGT